ncbi:MAG: mannose-6-phosphate isomerase, class [Actinomycetota bacterium]
MFEIDNEPRDYSWGSLTAIAELLGRTPTGRPEAELWLGDHPASPARVTGSGESLSEWGRQHPRELGAERLPFLVKVLAADSPLSIQAHPTLEQARAGFARDNAAGLADDAPNRNYRDANHKPEIIIALTEFSALCGFRPTESRERIVTHLAHLLGDAADLIRGDVAGAVERLLTRTDGVAELVAAISSLDPSDAVDADVRDALEVARSLALHYPGDPGIVVSLLLNHRVLAPGEALFLPAGNIHAYLHGVGIEVMSASDNVIRGGLTDKHIDVAELLDVLDFDELADPTLVPVVSGSVRRFAPPIPDFTVLDVRADGEVTLDVVGPAIAIVVSGEVELRGESTIALSRGRAAFVSATEKLASVSGTGHVFIATRPEN